MDEKLNQADSALSQARPLLKKCRVFDEGNRLILENLNGSEALILPKSYYPIILLFNGKRTVSQIISTLYSKYERVSFNSVMAAIDLLNNSGFLMPLDFKLGKAMVGKTPHDQGRSILMASIIELDLVKRIKFGKGPASAFYLFMLLMVVAAGYFLLQTGFSFDYHGFLRVEEGYVWSFPLFFALTCCLMSGKALLKSIMLIIGTGKLYHFGVRICLLGPALKVADHSIYSRRKKTLLVIYGMGSSFIYLFMTVGWIFFNPKFEYNNDLILISILLTFIELDPYRKSELTRIFNFFYADGQAKGLLPYLKNCSLFSLLKKEKVKDENRYLIYASLSMAWAVTFILFALNLIIANLPNLLLEIKMADPLNKVAAGAVLFFLVFIFLYLAIDLLHTFSQNIFAPFFGPLIQKVKKSKVKAQRKIDTEVILATLKNNLFFKEVSEEALSQLIKRSFLKKYKKNSSLIIQGEKSREVYLVLEGAVSVQQKSPTGEVKNLATLNKGAVIGEMAIITNEKRGASVITTKETSVLEIPGKSFKLLLKDTQFKNDFALIKRQVEFSHFVSSAGLFKDFPVEVLGMFVRIGKMIEVSTGTELVKEGESDKTFYLIIRGEFEVIIQKEVVAKLRQGEFFGEMALISNKPRSATVRSLMDCELLQIQSKDFWDILSQNLNLAMYLESVSRGRQNQEAVSS